MNPSQFTQALVEAAQAEKWERVDNELVPQLELVDGNAMAEELIKHVDDEDANVRDVVATSFSGLKDLKPETERKVAERMLEMAAKDEERYPAGRAMAYLLMLGDKSKFKDRVAEALTKFKARVEERGWMVDLKEAIPVLSDVL